MPPESFTESLIDALNADAFNNCEKRFQSQKRVRIQLHEDQFCRLWWDENTEDIFADIAWDFGMAELKAMA